MKEYKTAEHMEPYMQLKEGRECVSEWNQTSKYPSEHYNLLAPYRTLPLGKIKQNLLKHKRESRGQNPSYWACKWQISKVSDMQLQIEWVKLISKKWLCDLFLNKCTNPPNKEEEWWKHLWCNCAWNVLVHFCTVGASWIKSISKCAPNTLALI